MYATRITFALLIGTAAPVWAQSSASLNLQLPAPTTQQTTGVADAKPPADPAATSAAASNTPNLPAPYDTTYGERRDAAQNDCADETYSNPQVHGSVGMGVAASNRASATYETTEVNVSKPLGNCDDPKGEVSASVRVTKGNFNFGRRNGP